MTTETAPAEAAGLTVEKYPANGCGWRVKHVPSGQYAVIRSLRLRRHALSAMAELYATGLDFTQKADVLTDRSNPASSLAAQVVSDWFCRSQACCVDGEHYDPYTYRTGDDRCSSMNGLARSS
jgi:hypothetical protein